MSDKPRLFGMSFSVGGVSLISSYDRDSGSGYLNVYIVPSSTSDQRNALAALIHQFADDIECELGEGRS